MRSILSQAGVSVECIVVFNGFSVDADALNWAKAQPGTRCAVLEEPNKARATLLGRELAKGTFFCFLDDDDEFLPGAFAYATKILLANPELDCLATNGFYVTPNGTRCVFNQTREFEINGYANSLLRSRNWLASCGGMFRQRTVSTKYFENLPPHREWTVIAFRIATDLKVRFVNRLSYRVFSSPESQSKTASYVEAGTTALEAMLQWAKKPAHARAIRRRMSEAYHDTTSYYRLRSDFPRAWKAYWSSIRVGGLKYDLMQRS